MRNFIGRQQYLDHLENLWSTKKTQIVSLYGRRRIGKTRLLEVFSHGKPVFFFEALENETTQVQIGHFLDQMARQFVQPHLRDLAYTDWPPVLDLLTRLLSQKKSVLLCLDEFAWMAAGRTKLVSLIKYYWDKSWKNHPHFMLVLCGSMASWMVKNVVRSRALYGRISENILLEPLKPFEVAQFMGARRGSREIIDYLICFGGIPRYLEEFDFKKSLQVNIENTCFTGSGFFKDEADKIFYNQFREISLYKSIVKQLLRGPLFLKGIAAKTKSPSGGGLKTYVENLMSAGIVGRLSPIKDFKAGRTHYYVLSDEFLRFSSHFIEAHHDEIEHSSTRNKFEKFTRGKWYPFLGYAFERFCIKHRYDIAELLGFSDKVTGSGPVHDKKTGVQFDLVYLRSDATLSLCEMKYLQTPVPAKIIREFETKIKKIKIPRGLSVEKILICNVPPSSALTESGYFNQILDVSRILRMK